MSVRGTKGLRQWLSVSGEGAARPASASLSSPLALAQTSTAADKWALADPTLCEAMVRYVLDELEAGLGGFWSHKQRKEALLNFAKYYFTAKPDLSEELMRKLFLGDDKTSRGLIVACGEISWKSFRLLGSARTAMAIISRMVDSSENPIHSKQVLKVLTEVREEVLKAMRIEKHLSDERSKTAAESLLKSLKDFKPDFVLPDAVRDALTESSVLPSMTSEDFDDDEKEPKSGYATPKREGSKKGDSIFVSGTSMGGSSSSLLKPPGARKRVLLELLSNFFRIRPSREVVIKRGILKQGVIFGRPLVEVVLTPGSESNIPGILLLLVKDVRERSMDLEGLFRISGIQSEIAAIKQKIDFGQTVDLKAANPHSITGLIKAFFRELPEPLFPRSVFDEVAEAGAEENWEKLRNIVNKLPEPNLSVVKFLLRFLAEVAAKEIENKMNSRNLAICMVPNILKGSQEDLASVTKNSPKVIAAFKHLIDCELVILTAEDGDDSTIGKAAGSRMLHRDSDADPPLPKVLEFRKSTFVRVFGKSEEHPTLQSSSKLVQIDPYSEETKADVAKEDSDDEDPGVKDQPLPEKSFSPDLEERKSPAKVLSARSSGKAFFDGLKQYHESGKLALPEDSAVDLGATWAVIKDSESGDVYYYNQKTGESTWDKPETVRYSRKSGTPIVDMKKESVVESPEVTFTGVIIGEVWKEFKDKDGEVFYYNARTGESQWEIPSYSLQSSGIRVEKHSEDEKSPRTRPLATLSKTVKVSGRWSGRSSGGRFPVVSWFQNPQYLVRVEKSPCILNITLSLAEGCEDRALGIHIVRVAVTRKAFEGRIVSVKDPEDIIYVGPFDMPAISTSIRVEIPGEGDAVQLMLVPATLEPSSSSIDFSLEVAEESSEIVRVFTIEDPPGGSWWEERARGSWDTFSAGGCYPNFFSWRKNPQYELVFEDRTHPHRILVHLHKSGKESAAKERDSVGAASFGFYVLKNTGGAASRKFYISDGDVVLRSEFVSLDDLIQEIDLEPLGPVDTSRYIIMPCMFYPDSYENFVLGVYSDSPVSLVPIGRPAEVGWKESVIFKNKWTGLTAGGCRNYKTWKMNPRYELKHIESKLDETVSFGKAVIILGQPTNKAILAIGMYVVNSDDQIIAKASFMMAPEVYCQVTITPKSLPLYVVPCTFQPGLETEFMIQVISETHLTLSETS